MNSEQTPPAETPSVHPIKQPYSDWRSMIDASQRMQAERRASSFSSEKVLIDMKDRPGPIRIICISDWHAGSYGTDYDLWLKLTETVLRERLYVICVGDMLQMSIKLRGVLEVVDNVLTPQMQMRFLQTWCEELGGVLEGDGLLLASTWDNHSVMRTENATGTNEYGEIFSRFCSYFNGIGHLDLMLGEQVYKIALSHFFRGKSIINPTHSQMRYARMEANDREVIISGDSHTFGATSYREGGLMRHALNCGSLQTNSGYGKRFFSQDTATEMPCLMLWPDKHQVVTFNDVDAMLDVTGRKG